MKILGEEIDFASNLRYSARRYNLWWLLLLATIAFDYLSTVGFVSHLGLEREANPVARWLMQGLGLHCGLIATKLLQLFAVTVIVALNRRIGNIFLLIIVLLNTWAVVVNSL